MWKRGYQSLCGFESNNPIANICHAHRGLLSSWKQNFLNGSHPLCSPSPDCRALPFLHILLPFSPCCGKGLVRMCKKEGQVSVGEWQRGGGCGGGAEQGLEEEHPSQVPGRRALRLPTAVALILIFLAGDKKNLDLAETPILTLKMYFIRGIWPSLPSEYQGFERCI